MATIDNAVSTQDLARIKGVVARYPEEKLRGLGFDDSDGLVLAAVELQQSRLVAIRMYGHGGSSARSMYFALSEKPSDVATREGTAIRILQESRLI